MNDKKMRIVRIIGTAIAKNAGYDGFRTPSILPPQRKNGSTGEYWAAGVGALGVGALGYGRWKNKRTTKLLQTKAPDTQQPAPKSQSIAHKTNENIKGKPGKFRNSETAKLFNALSKKARGCRIK